MANEDFENLIATATTDASASRKELGYNYAVEFRENPESFDPRKLMRLGKEGLLSFVTTVGVPVHGLDPAHEPEVELTETVSVNLGWRNKQNVPLPFELIALLCGVVGGIAIVFGSAIALTF